MEPDELRGLTAAELANTLDQVGVPKGWVIADLIRACAAEYPGQPCLPEPPERRPLGAFRNLVVGTMTERVFHERHLEPLEGSGFMVADYHARGEHRDFGLQKDGVGLPINVKVASTMFRNAKQVVGLEPEDTIPISAHKAIGAVEKVPELVYVDLVDFALRPKADAFMDGLDGPLATAWTLLGAYGGKGRRKAEDAYIDALFRSRGDELRALIRGGEGFRVISAQRVLSILRDKPRRVPGLGVPAAGTGAFVSEVNVHISVGRETTPWAEVERQCVNDGIPSVLARIRRRESREVAAPSL